MTAALGNTIDLTDQNRRGPLIVQEGESLNVRAAGRLCRRPHPEGGSGRITRNAL